MPRVSSKKSVGGVAPRPVAVDPYAVLGVGYTLAIGRIRDRFIAASLRAHPDKGGDPSTMAALTEAWAMLSSPKLRAKTDELLRLSGAWPAKLCGRCDGAGEVRGRVRLAPPVPCPACGGAGRG